MKLLLTLLLAVASTQAGVAPKADCTWRINSLPEPQALYIKVNGTKDLNGFWLPQSGDQVSVPAGEQVIFACPGGTLNGVGTTEAVMTCIGSTQWEAPGGQTYSFSSLRCSKDPVHTSIMREDLSCNVNISSTKFMQIGFELLNGDFYVVIETCFKEDTYDSIYTLNIQTNAIGGFQSGYPRPDDFEQGQWYDGIDASYQYSCNDGQIEAITYAVGDASLATSYVQCGTDYFLSRGHMTAKADFVYGAHQLATFWFLNVAPQWQTVNGANWNNLEMSTRNFADSHVNDLLVWTGTHGTTTLTDINGQQAPIYLHYNGTATNLRAPEFFWRVIYDPTTRLGTAFVGLNNPYIDNPGPEFYLCPDVCSQISWINWNPTDQRQGYAYCCEISALAQFVEEIPPIDAIGLLT